MPAAFDRTKPAIADTRALTLTEINENFVALWLDAITGGDGNLPWSFAVTAGTNAKPTQIVLSSGTLRVKYDITWGSTGSNYITAITVAYSTNSGGAYDSAHAALTYGYTSGEVTSGNVGSLVLAFVMKLIGLITSGSGSVTAHAALTGTSVHGLGTMSTQN